MSKHTDRLSDALDLRGRYASLAVDYVSSSGYASEATKVARERIFALAGEAEAKAHELVRLERRIGEIMDDLR